MVPYKARRGRGRANGRCPAGRRQRRRRPSTRPAVQGRRPIRHSGCRTTLACLAASSRRAPLPHSRPRVGWSAPAPGCRNCAGRGHRLVSSGLRVDRHPSAPGPLRERAGGPPQALGTLHGCRRGNPERTALKGGPGRATERPLFALGALGSAQSCKKGHHTLRLTIAAAAAGSGA